MESDGQKPSRAGTAYTSSAPQEGAETIPRGGVVFSAVMARAALIRKLGLQSHVVEARTPEEFNRAFARLSVESVNGVVLLADPSVIEHAQKIAELAPFSAVRTSRRVV